MNNNDSWFETPYREELGKYLFRELDADIISVFSFMAYSRVASLTQGATANAVVDALNKIPFLTTPEE